MTEIVRIENLQKSFGELDVLTGIDMNVQAGETVVLLGSSSSGKSTLLRCLNFMEIPTEGRVFIHGEPVGEARNGEEHYRERDLSALRTRTSPRSRSPSHRPSAWTRS